jgi:hypothetical protein
MSSVITEERRILHRRGSMHLGARRQSFGRRSFEMSPRLKSLPKGWIDQAKMNPRSTHHPYIIITAFLLAAATGLFLSSTVRKSGPSKAPQAITSTTVRYRWAGFYRVAD